MNKALFVSSFQRTAKLYGIFTALILFYLIVIIGMYTSSVEADPFEMLPEGMKDAFGLGAGMNGLTGFVASSFYGVSFVIFMMILCIMAANQLMAHLVDRGSMAYLLSTPVSRRKIATTQAAVLITGLFALTGIALGAGLLAAPLLAEQAEFDRHAFVQLNVTGFLLFFVISGYSFLFSSLFNDAKHSLAASGGLSVLFYMIHLIGNMTDNHEWLDYLTPLSLFEPAAIAAGEVNVALHAVSLGAAGIALYASAVYLFSRRDLPL
ncbi:ABC transporter permease subunit [Paenibacillus sp. N4]|uniref:ABC transporter permease subunit n=1 Tax=Paenibacillus vietnamensis TaxID=2590547 RepID=UPI001CD168A5|nr:ABC transporter permease subunit [Paenibacillus vietnamensis]MCA0756357.1 ABC transporter permease subunit [Paenibacillus vietnamensis]